MVTNGDGENPASSKSAGKGRKQGGPGPRGYVRVVCSDPATEQQRKEIEAMPT